MHFTNLTGANVIGANCYLLELSGQNILLDCGTNPKEQGRAALPRLDLIQSGSLDSILVSHSHMDHIGALPVTQRLFPEADVYMAEACCELGAVMLHNSCNIMMKERQNSGILDYPLFTHREVDLQERLWHPLKLGRARELRSQERTGGVQVTPFNAGHVLGSTCLYFESSEGKVFYTGDINLSDQALMKKALIPDIPPPDLLIVECTRGTTDAGGEDYREIQIREFVKSLEEVLSRGGNVLVPCFALGKQQETLTLLHQLKTQGKLSDYPIVIGGMGKKISEIYDLYGGHESRMMNHFSLIKDMRPRVIPREKVPWWQTHTPTIFAISAGMLTEKTPAYTAAEKFLSKEGNAVFFVGYVDAETPGGRLLKAGQGGKVTLGTDSPEQDVLCQIKRFDFTAHAHRGDILSLVKKLKPRKTLLVHGDQPALEWFSGEIKNLGLDCDIPQPGHRYSL